MLTYQLPHTLFDQISIRKNNIYLNTWMESYPLNY